MGAVRSRRQWLCTKRSKSSSLVSCKNGKQIKCTSAGKVAKLDRKRDPVDRQRFFLVGVEEVFLMAVAPVLINSKRIARKIHTHVRKSRQYCCNLTEKPNFTTVFFASGTSANLGSKGQKTFASFVSLIFLCLSMNTAFANNCMNVIKWRCEMSQRLNTRHFQGEWGKHAGFTISRPEKKRYRIKYHKTKRERREGPFPQILTSSSHAIYF